MISRVILLMCALAVSNCALSGDSINCPADTTRAGETTPDGTEAWCDLDYKGTVVLHGPYRAWWPNGTLGTSGQYSYGKSVGKWSGWFPSGKLQGEEWFEDGQMVQSRYFTEEGVELPKPLPPNPPLQPMPDGAAKR